MFFWVCLVWGREESENQNPKKDTGPHVSELQFSPGESLANRFSPLDHPTVATAAAAGLSESQKVGFGENPDVRNESSKTIVDDESKKTTSFGVLGLFI